jgi:hypothetical protein
LRNVFFFHVHPLVIEKMGDALGNLHSWSPLVVGCGNILTPLGQIGYCLEYQKYWKK